MFSGSAPGTLVSVLYPVFPVFPVHACHFMWVCYYQLVFMLLDFFSSTRSQHEETRREVLNICCGGDFVEGIQHLYPFVLVVNVI